jgi:hypothetical protein
MAFVLLTLHILWCAAAWLLIRFHIWKVRYMHLPLIFFVPVWGTLAVLLITHMSASRTAGRKFDELENMRGDETLESAYPARKAEAETILPMEDALILNNAATRRSVMMDVLMQDSEEYLPALQEARKTDDVEVVHYATTAMVEMNKKNEIRMQRFEHAYAEQAGDTAFLRRYLDFLEMYIRGGLAEGQVLSIARDRYQKILTSLIAEQKADEEDYANLASSYLDAKQYPAAGDVLQIMKDKWPTKESLFYLQLRLAYETGNVSELRKTIRERRELIAFDTKEVRDVMAFWEKKAAI